jgi:hypothetical protein
VTASAVIGPLLLSTIFLTAGLAVAWLNPEPLESDGPEKTAPAELATPAPPTLAETEKVQRSPTPLNPASLQIDVNYAHEWVAGWTDPALEGEFGLEVTPGCGFPFALEITEPPVPTLPEEARACTTITAANVEIVPPGAIFRAGEWIAFGDSFGISPDAPFSGILDESLIPFAFVQDDSPSSEEGYRAVFYLRLDQLDLVVGDRLEHFVGHSADGEAQFRVVLRRNPVLPENRLILEARLDDGSYASTSETAQEIWLPDGWNRIELRWTADESGEFVASVQGPPFEAPPNFDGLTNLANAGGRVDSVRWGVVGGALDATAGSLEVDQFVSWR